jgi:hypothetical protein
MRGVLIVDVARQRSNPSGGSRGGSAAYLGCGGAWGGRRSTKRKERKQMVAVASPGVHCNGSELLSTSTGSGDEIGRRRWLIEQGVRSRSLRRGR